MSQVMPIAAISKPNQGKGAARALRREGFVPAVIYDTASQSQTIAVKAHDLARALRHGHFFTNTQELNLDGKTVKVLARVIQRHPVNEAPLHVDFMKYDAKKMVNVNVVVNVVGQENSPGLKLGGVLQLIEAELEVVCRADSIPQEINVDVTGLNIGESVHLSSLQLPEGVKSAVTDRDLTIASIVSTRTSKMEEEAAAATPEAGAAPEAKPEEAKK